MVHLDIFVPPLVVAHLVGLCALVYSLEKVTGAVSRARRRLSRLLACPALAPAAGPSSAPPSTAEAAPPSPQPAPVHALGAPTAPRLASGAPGGGAARSPGRAPPARPSDWDSSQIARELLASGGAAPASELHRLALRWVRGCAHAARPRLARAPRQTAGASATLPACRGLPHDADMSPQPHRRSCSVDLSMQISSTSRPVSACLVGQHTRSMAWKPNHKKHRLNS